MLNRRYRSCLFMVVDRRFVLLIVRLLWVVVLILIIGWRLRWERTFKGG